MEVKIVRGISCDTPCQRSDKAIEITNNRREK